MGPFTKTGNISGENVWEKITGGLTLHTEFNNSEGQANENPSRELEIQVKSKI